MQVQFCSQPSHIDSKIQNFVGQSGILHIEQDQFSQTGELWHRVACSFFMSEATKKNYYLDGTSIYVKNKDLVFDPQFFPEMFVEAACTFVKLNSVKKVSKGYDATKGHIVVETTDTSGWGIPKTWFGFPVSKVIVE